MSNTLDFSVPGVVASEVARRISMRDGEVAVLGLGRSGTAVSRLLLAAGLKVYASDKGDLSFSEEDVFIGLCPDSEIDWFETNFPPFLFIDPTRPTKWYATKLIEARQRLDIKYSVV